MRWARRVWEVLKLAWFIVRYSVGFAGALAGVVRLMRRLDVPTVWHTGREIASSLNRLWMFRVINFLILNPAHAGTVRFTAANPRGQRALRRDGHPPEDAILQNQLTLVTDVQPGEVHRQRAVLGLIDLNPWLAVEGSLVGISTIHSVRWALIDGGKRMLMASNFDGSWENYIDEFAGLIPTGLDALWRSSRCHPRGAFERRRRAEAIPPDASGRGQRVLQRLQILHRAQCEGCARTGPLVRMVHTTGARGGAGSDGGACRGGGDLR